MENNQITIDDLVSAYQKEISSLVHNKIINALQVEKLNNQVETLLAENASLKVELEKKSKRSSATNKSDSDY